MATTALSKKESPSKTEGTLSKSESALIDAYWRAANYLSVGQIYLFDNPLLREPLKEEHIKPRLLGHWGTTPGLNFIYVHLNRLIKKLDLDMIYITGPGHGGPGLVANAYLEGTYSEVYPGVSQDVEGMKRLFTQFSFPGGIPSHVAPETPGSIHEGGELGYALSHAFGAAFDNPDLIVAAVVGDDVLELVRDGDYDFEETGESVSALGDRIVSANAYLGCEPIVTALSRAANVVITGRVADPGPPL